MPAFNIHFLSKDLICRIFRAFGHADADTKKCHDATRAWVRDNAQVRPNKLETKQNFCATRHATPTCPLHSAIDPLTGDR